MKRFLADKWGATNTVAAVAGLVMIGVAESFAVASLSWRIVEWSGLALVGTATVTGAVLRRRREAAARGEADDLVERVRRDLEDANRRLIRDLQESKEIGEASEENLNKFLNHIVASIAQLIGDVASSPPETRDNRKTALVMKCLQALLETAHPPDDKRVAMLRLEVEEEDGVAVRHLIPGHWDHGIQRASHKPRRRFRDDDYEYGRQVFEIMDREELLWIRDVAQPPEFLRYPPGQNRSYRTLMSVAITSGDKQFGMLTLDTSEVDALDEGNAAALNAIAGLLAAGLAIES